MENQKKESLDTTLNECESSNKKIIDFINNWWLIVLIIYLAFYILNQVKDFYFEKQDLCFISQEIESLGQMGDFFGGMFNPILGFLSFCLLLITIKLQSKELKNSTEELAKSSKALTEQSKSLKIQNFETTFFNMINLHNEIVNNSSLSMLKNYYELKTGVVPIYRISKAIPEENKIYFYTINGTKVNLIEDKEYNGRKTLYKLFEILNQYIKDNIDPHTNNQIGLYNVFHTEYSQIINHYFRNLYHILKIVDKEDDFTLEKKRSYVSILRAQISNYELALIFMNSIYNKDDHKLFPLLVKFKFMEPLNLVIAQPYDGTYTFHKYLIDQVYLKYVIKDYIEMIIKIEDYQYIDSQLFGENTNMNLFINEINKENE